MQVISERSRIVVKTNEGIVVSDTGWVDTNKLGGAEVEDWDDKLVRDEPDSLGPLLLIGMVISIVVAIGLGWIFGGVT